MTKAPDRIQFEFNEFLDLGYPMQNEPFTHDYRLWEVERVEAVADDDGPGMHGTVWCISIE